MHAYATHFSSILCSHRAWLIRLQKSQNWLVEIALTHLPLSIIDDGTDNGCSSSIEQSFS